ncbi:MAG TPA: hypothetical protein VNX25_04315 [Verrucomicrobiae bacterium]|nr:hypothetical protein [Verrucomicrobiae bacterium]
MKRIFPALALLMAVSLIVFGTWQLFQGNLEASFSTLPVLLALYFLLVYSKK